MHTPKWALFFDFHTMPANPDVGKAFDFDAITDWFVRTGVDYVVFPARCNLGVAYYDTEIGIRHPALEYNLLGELAAACHRRGIRISAYINVGLSHEEGLRRRDWLVIPPSGEIYGKDRLNHFFRQMCYYSGYGDHVTAMACEVIEKCDVDGLFLDCMATVPCIGVECMRRMKEEGVNWEDPDELYAFNYRKIVGMARRICEAAKSVKSDLMLYCNGVDYEAQADFATYIEFECLPTGGWGYEMLPVGARYLRTLGKPVLNMTARFHRSWGDFGGIRTEPSLEYDLIKGIAHGLRCTIGDHFHPRGDLNKAVMDLDTRLYRKLQALEPWIDGAEPLVDAAVPMVMPYPGYKFRTPGKAAEYNRQFNAIKAAVRALAELKVQFDVPSHASSWDRYQLLVLPDYVVLDEETQRRVRAHLDRGGSVVSTGWSGLDPQRQRFVFEEWGVDYEGESPYDPAYIRFEPAFADGMPDMPVTLYDRGIRVSARTGTEVLAEIVAPYYNRHWDGEHGFVYLPPDRPTGTPAVTLRGRVAHVTHPIFTSYFNYAPVPMRQIVANLVQRLLPEPLVQAPNAPSFARITVTSQPGRRMVYILGYVPEQRGAGTNMIEEPITLRDQEIRLRLDGRAPQTVYLAPERRVLPFRIDDGYACVVVPEVPGWVVVVFEE